MGLFLWIFVVILWLFFYTRVAVYRWWKERKRMVELVDRIPGMMALPILGNSYMFKWKIEEFGCQMLEQSAIFQATKEPLFRTWLGPFPVVAAFSPDSIKEILESNTVITKGTEYGVVRRWLGTGLLTSTGAKWRQRRKMLTPAFHFNILNGFLQIHDKEAQIFIKELEPFAESGQEFDLYPYLKRCALDIICETSMGVKVDAQTNHQHPYVDTVRRMNELSFLYVRMPWLWLKPVWYSLGYGGEYDEKLALATDFTRKVIRERRLHFHNEDSNGGKTKRYAFLDLLLSIQEEGKLTDEDIREEVDTFMFEGHDTTSSGMAWSLWCLAHHLEEQEKCIAEIDAVFGRSDRECTSEDLKELKYLEQCIKEAMRLFPPVPIFTRMVEEDFECSGYVIPRGCTMLVAPFILHRDKNLFENPGQFNPDNFSTENLLSRHPFSYIPFSAGPRNCIGQKFALMEEKTVLSWFFRRYIISTNKDFDSTLPCPEIILRPSKGIPVRIHRRTFTD